jgi:hypothetical protein
MKFELEPYHRNISKQQVVEDIRRVAQKLKRDTLTKSEYRQYGTISPDVAERICGSWFKALSESGLRKSRNYNISAEDCLADLKRVAQKLGKSSVTTEDYKAHGQFSPAPLVRHFGSWFAALDAAGLERTRILHVTDEDYFKNLEQMWVHIGRQPHYSEVQKPFSRYSVRAYEYRFGSWRKALESFVASVNQEPETEGYVGKQPIEHTEEKMGQSEDKQLSPPQISRHISWRLRFLVMRRDSFKCQSCGRNPAMTAGVILNVDHIHPWSKGGPTQMDNLQTLCEQCNIGKSDLPMKEEESKS